MDWILDHLQIIIAVAGAIAYWLNARNKEKTGEPADYDGDGSPDVNRPPAGGAMREAADTFDPEDNTRRIQEEIRRKIAERSGGTGQPTPPPLEPVPRAEPSGWDQAQARRRQEAVEARRVQAEAHREEAARESAAVLERQQALAAQLAALQARRAEAGREAKAVWMTAPESAAAAAATSARVGSRADVGLLGELRNASSLRKAIVLREVLGTPVGLR